MYNRCTLGMGNNTILRDTVIIYLVIIVPCHLLQYRNIVFTIYHDIATIYRNTVMLFTYKSLNTKQILLILSFNSQKNYNF